MLHFIPIVGESEQNAMKMSLNVPKNVKNKHIEEKTLSLTPLGHL